MIDYIMAVKSSAAETFHKSYGVCGLQTPVVLGGDAFWAVFFGKVPQVIQASACRDGGMLREPPLNKKAKAARLKIEAAAT